ncbi:MAG: hypothetical protein LBH53_01795 [Puniceicoccales bacterium]|nr:hypothetical protein [Puniceicoccales bacterium]
MLVFLVLAGIFLLAMDLFLAVAGQRARVATEREIARQNARAALQMALNALAAAPAEGRFITSTAANVCATSNCCSHWTGLWSVVDGRATFSRWLVSGEDALVEDFSAPAVWSGPSAAPLWELGLPDSCPLESVLTNGKVQGHWAFWISDEAAKVRINLPPPEREEPRVAQEFGGRWLLEQGGGIAEQRADLQAFSDLRTLLPGLNPRCFHAVTFRSRGVLQTTSGQWPIDLNDKLLPGNFQPAEFLFPAREDLPQPPPTFGLLASYLSAAQEVGPDGALPFRSGGPIYRQLYGPQGCDHRLGDLPAPSHGHELPTSYGIHPVLCGAWLTISARVVNGAVLTILLRPQFAIWNPLSTPIALHRYGFCWRVTECKERWDQELGAKPALNLKIGAKNWAKIPLGDGQTGCLCRGSFEAALGPGQILLLSPDQEQIVTAGSVLEGTFSPTGDDHWQIRWGLDEDPGEILLGRLAAIPNRARWDGQTIQLTDNEGTILQEVADFIDGDGPIPLPYRTIPQDGHDYPIFQLRAHLRADRGPSPRWLADHNPRAPQIRRSAFEHGYSLPLPRSDRFSRSYPSWQVELQDFSGDGPPPVADLGFLGKNAQPILFDVPRKFFSIASLQHISLFPFSYHPAYAVGNSWAPYLLPREESWIVADPCAHEYFRGEMRLDGSYLANRALFGGYFVGGFENGSTHSHCRPWDPSDGTDAQQNSPRLLTNWGAFNVNGASAEAWKIFLRSMPFDFATGTYSISRHLGQKDQEGSPWGRCRLTAEELDRLAECIAAEVRSDGPFASLDQFVNRRLGPASNPATRCGPLQRAIEAAMLRKFPPLPANGSFGERAMDRPMAAEDANALCPGDLSQADLLQFFGNGLTVRGDTFLIRAYGDGSDGSESNPIFALLEGIVQRCPDGTWRLEELRRIH